MMTCLDEGVVGVREEIGAVETEWFGGTADLFDQNQQSPSKSGRQCEPSLQTVEVAQTLSGLIKAAINKLTNRIKLTRVCTLPATAAKPVIVMRTTIEVAPATNRKIVLSDSP